MSDKLTSQSGPIPPEHWDGEPSRPNRTPAGQKQADEMVARHLARIRGTPAPAAPTPPTKPAA